MKFILSPNYGVRESAVGMFSTFSEAKEYAVREGMVASHSPVAIAEVKPALKSLAKAA